MNIIGLGVSLKTKRMKKKIDWTGNVPKHIAIMMDGNGRWATGKGLPRTAGHYAGMKTMRDTIRICRKNQVRFLTLYAFSTENWKRPREEVDYIISLVNEFVTDATLHEMNDNNIKINFIGDISRFSDETRRIMTHAADLTESNDGMTVNFAMNYGGRSEIIHAMQTCLIEGQQEPSEEQFDR